MKHDKEVGDMGQSIMQFLANAIGEYQDDPQFTQETMLKNVAKHLRDQPAGFASGVYTVLHLLCDSQIPMSEELLVTIGKTRVADFRNNVKG